MTKEIDGVINKASGNNPKLGGYGHHSIGVITGEGYFDDIPFPSFDPSLLGRSVRLQIGEGATATFLSLL